MVVALLLTSGTSLAGMMDEPAQLPEAQIAAARQALRVSGYGEFAIGETGYRAVFAYALFEQLTSRGDRIDTYSLVRCQAADKDKMVFFGLKEPLPMDWTCNKPYKQVRFLANGTHHKFQLFDEIDNNTILEIADYVFSRCFVQQVAELRKSSVDRPPRRIVNIRRIDDGFSITTDQSLIYRMKHDRETVTQCPMTVIGVSTLKY